MEKQVTIKAVSRREKTSSSGKPFTSVGLKTVEYGDKWLSGFGNKDNASWKEGDKVTILVEQKGEYLNFTMPNSKAGQEAAQQELKRTVFNQHNEIQNLTARIVKIEKQLGINPQDSAFPPYPKAPDPKDIDDAFAKQVADENNW